MPPRGPKDGYKEINFPDGGTYKVRRERESERKRLMGARGSGPLIAMHACNEAAFLSLPVKRRVESRAERGEETWKKERRLSHTHSHTLTHTLAHTHTTDPMFQGNMVDGMPEGWGVSTDPSGNVYTGQFSKGVPEG